MPFKQKEKLRITQIFADRFALICAIRSFSTYHDKAASN